MKMHEAKHCSLMYLEQLEGQRDDLDVACECVARMSNVNLFLLPRVGHGSLAVVSFVQVVDKGK